MKLDYIHSQRTAGAEKKRAAVVRKAARELSNKPGILIRADQLSLTECTSGWSMRRRANRTASSCRYRFSYEQLFQSAFPGSCTGAPESEIHGSGITTASGNFRPQKAGADWDLHLKYRIPG